MKINIKGKEIELRETYSAHIIYENRMKESFKLEDMGDMFITKYMNFLYAIILGSDKKLELTFEEFQDWVDDNMDVLPDFIEWYWDRVLQNADEIAADKNDEKVDKKKED